MRYYIGIILWCFLLSCSRDTGNVGSVFWRYGQYMFEFRDVIKDQKLVMVTLDLGFSHLVEEEFKDQIIAYQPAKFQQPGYALIHYDTSLELDRLAMYAHGGEGLHCGRMEVIDLNLRLSSSPATIFEPIYHETILLSDAQSLLANVTKSNIESNVTTLENLGSRRHSSTSGIQAPAEIATLLEAAHQNQIALSLEYVDHPTTSQQSIILKVTGSQNPEEIVILGAHLDSISYTSAAPGADDNASGVSTLIEVLRVLATNQIEFARTVEFHFYAAEEVGLVGSKDIAANYKSEGKKVTAMMQFDMNSWSQDSEDQTIHLVSTNTSVSLTRSLKELLKTYLGGDYIEKTLTAGTSDFKAWHDQGFAASFPFEDPHNYNSSIHTPGDTSAKVNNLSLSVRFAKLGLVYLAHHAGIRSSDTEYQTKLEATTIDSAASKVANLAIIDSENGTYNLAASTEESVVRVEYCKVASGQAVYCAKERGVLDNLGAKNSRAIFATSTSIDISNQDYIRIYGYNSDDKLIVSRSVRLDEK